MGLNVHNMTDNILQNIPSFKLNVMNNPHNIVNPQNIVMDMNNVM